MRVGRVGEDPCEDVRVDVDLVEFQLNYMYKLNSPLPLQKAAKHDYSPPSLTSIELHKCRSLIEFNRVVMLC